MGALQAAGTERHLPRLVGPAGTQPAVGGVCTSTAVQQPVLLQRAPAPPGAVRREQMVHLLLSARASQPKSAGGKSHGAIPLSVSSNYPWCPA